ncbi:MAG: hypothetical protein JSS30_01725 [Verrucomicrobia bacterium]|nr:hypothetical protein [Verrucomicrobiota bacterium]
MIDKIDYFKHKIYDPSYYHRQYENDLPPNEETASYTETAKRATHIALPFLSLYQPFGLVISLTMGSVRVVSTTSEVISGDLLKIAQVALAMIALAGTLYHFTLGLYITTGADIITNLMQIVEALSQGEHQRAAEELMQVVSSLLYLAIMMTGSMEVVAVSLLVQAIVTFYQARQEIAKGRLPEAIAKTILGMVRLIQMGQQIQLIQRRNALIKRYDQVAKAILNGRKIDHLWDHPLIGKEGVVLEDGNGNAYDFGANLHGHGKQLVKGMNVTMRDKGDCTTLEFKINHLFRDKLQQTLEKMSDYSQEDIKELLKLMGSHAKNLNLTEISKQHNGWMPDFKSYEVQIDGVGKIRIGADPDCITLYDKITIEMEKGKNLYDFHEALAFLNLEDALRQSAGEDIERMKMGHLFRIFKPREATPFERTEAFFQLPLDEFKSRIIAISPEMKGIFENYLPKMQLREIIPGRMRYAINGLSDELSTKGALGLTAGLTGAWTDQEIYERVTSILKMGMMSSEMRRDNEVGKKGLSWGADYFTGGADSVFTQVVTDKTESYDQFMYHSDVRFLISPKAIENGTYQYHYDAFGTRKTDSWWWWNAAYLDRENIFEFLKEERAFFNGDNELMLKERLAPELITGIVVNNQEMKNGILNYLREKSIIQIDSTGQETIFSKPVDQFISVGSKISKEQFA